MLLAGDIGGTHTRLALLDPGRPRLPVVLETYASGDAPGLEALLARFLATHAAHPVAAAFGIAGPILDARVETTNLPWVVDAALLSRCLGGVPVRLLNDLEALALGLAELPDAARTTLNAGTPVPRGTRAVIAAGTGLGEAALVRGGGGWIAVPSEGGHTDYAPQSEREVALLRFLRARFGHVSWERVLSGPGLVHLLDFVHEVEGMAVPATLATAMATGDAGAAVTRAALAGDVPAARAALALFVAAYGAEAGNLALKLKATGGVFVGGGIAPRIAPLLGDGRFRDAFLAKGRFADLLARIPVWLVQEEHTALFGAAHAASLLAA
jgi:glucokinase